MRLPVLNVRHLVASWVVYWAGLLAVVAGRPLWRYWQLQLGSEHGTVGFSYTGSATRLALWIAGPPLLLFLLWLVARSRAAGTAHAGSRPVA